MYREYFGFRIKPFGLTPDTRFIFLSQNHREGFAHLWYGIHQGGGFIVLTGEVGTGKTTLLRSLLSRLDAEKWRSALIFNPPSSPGALFQEILLEFGLPAQGRNPNRLMRALNSFLLQENEAGRSVLLIIDEAQNLCPEVLEKIRLLSNLETERRKLLHIVLAGQPELGRLLARGELRQLRQRVSVYYHLRSMNYEDTRRYIEHRLTRAGAGGAIFSPRALAKVCRFSQGIPRLINILCDRCLLASFAAEKKTVTRAMVGKAAVELKSNHHPSRNLRYTGALWISLLLALVVLAASWGLLHFLPTKAERSSIAAAVGSSGDIRPVSSVSPARRNDPEFKVPADDGNRMAFNAMAKAWGVSEVDSEELVSEMPDFFLAVRKRGLEVSRVQGPLSKVFALNYPFLVKVDGSLGPFLVAVHERSLGKVRVTPPIGDRSWISQAELTRFWEGEVFLVWRNDLGLSTVLNSGDRGRQVEALQELLLAVGEKGIRVDGVYGRETIQALRNFQLRQGLEMYEKLDMSTLLYLYQAADRYGVPKLREG